MLECTGATLRPLDTSPPTISAPPTHSQNAPVTPAPTVAGSNGSETTAAAPLSDDCLGMGTVSLADHVRKPLPKAGSDGDSQTEGTGVSALVSAESPMSRPLARNVTLRMGRRG